MSHLPTVSVVVPSYNGEQFIGQAIQSVLDQTYPVMELVIVDDASTDRTVEIVQQFRDPRVRLVCAESNSGVRANWNRALQEARGDLVKLLCEDDLLYPTCLQRQVEVLEQPENASVVAVCARRDIIDAKGRILIKGRGYRRAGVMPGGDAIRETARSGTNPFGEPASLLLRRSATISAGEFDDIIPYCIDIEYWCRVFALGDLFALNDTLAAFRVSKSACSTKMAATQGRQGRAFVEMLRQAYPQWVSPLDATRGKALATMRSYLRQVLYPLLAGRG